MELGLAFLIGGIAGIVIDRAADRLPAAYHVYNAPLPYRRWLIVLTNAVALAFLWTRFGASVQLLLASIYTVVFLLVLVIDYERRVILNVVILPAIIFAALASPLAQIGWRRSLVGGAVAFVVVFGIYIFAELFSRWRGLKIQGGAFGQGDVKLATFMGIVTGFPAVFPAILYTILLGGVGAILFIAYQLIAHRRLALTAAIPYGPFFCIAGWALMVFGM